MKPALNCGTCQWCGSVQKLPRKHGAGVRIGLTPVLAKHGYTVKHRGQGGFFSGTCSGSGHAPFEKSKGLIDESIDSALAAIISLLRKIDEIERTPTHATKAWVHIYHPELSTRTRGAVYLWEECELQADGQYRCFCTTKDGRVHHYHQGIERQVRDGIRNYGAHLRGNIQELEDYIARQRRRAARWVPDAPLLPLV